MAKTQKASLENDPNYEPRGEVFIANDAPIAGSIMDAALTARMELHKEEDDRRDDVVADGETSLEALRDQITLIAQRGDWNEHSQTLVRIALESIVQTSDRGDSTEALAATDALAGEPVSPTVALEALDDILAAISDHASAGYGKVKQTLLASLGHIGSAIPHLEDKWRKMEIKLHREVDNKPGHVNPSGIAKRLMVQGKFPSSLGRYLQEYAEHVKTIATSFDHQAQEAVVRNADLLAAIEYQSAGDFETSYKHASDSWMDPRKELSKDAMEFIVPGGDPFFTSKSTTYKGDDKAILAFDLYATKNIPASGRYGNLFSLRKNEHVEELPPLDLGEMRSLCKVFMEVTEHIKLEQRSAGEALAHAQVKAEFFSKRRAEADKSVKSWSREAYRYLDKAYGMTYELGQFKYGVLSTFIKVSNALFLYMERSLDPVVKKPDGSDRPHASDQYSE